MSKEVTLLHEQMDMIFEKLKDLDYEYDNMSSSGKETLGKLYEITGLVKHEDSKESYDKRIKELKNEGWYLGKNQK